MNTSLFGMFQSSEIMWIAIVVLVLFGAKKVPELMKGVGTGIKEFKKASKDVQDEVHRAMEEEQTTAPAPKPRAPVDAVAQKPAGTLPENLK
ncbi:MAG TPA: twin-arginine translocase TatA/TatE family subunit [Candidatus Limnocylindria bacterium]|nr:twin-arginine translocase TatA/TatE family subunit [Candidatus Limnocylindria bacterium]